MATTNRPPLGMLGWLGIGEESTYGSAVVPANYLEIESESMAKEVARIEAKTLQRRGIVDNKIVPGAIAVMGDIAFPAQYDGWLKFAKHAFGSVVNSQPDITNAPTAWNHQFIMTDVLPTGLTCEVFRDTSAFTTEALKSFRYSGCKVDKISFDAQVDQVLKVSVGLMGQNEGRVPYSNANPSFSAAQYAIFTQGQLLWNGNDLEVDKFQLTFQNGLGSRYKLGSSLTREPMPENKISVSGSFEAEFAEWNEYDDFINTAERVMILQFIGSSLGAAITNRIKLTCNQTIIDKTHIIMDKPGRIKLGIDFKCFRNTTQTQNEIIMDVTNTSATV
jgi:hypothetical protein